MNKILQCFSLVSLYYSKLRCLTTLNSTILYYLVRKLHQNTMVYIRKFLKLLPLLSVAILADEIAINQKIDITSLVQKDPVNSPCKIQIMK